MTEIDLSRMFVIKAKTEAEIEKVMDVRWEGDGEYFQVREAVRDDYGVKGNYTLLLALDDEGRPLGAIRLLYSRVGETKAKPSSGGTYLLIIPTSVPGVLHICIRKCSRPGDGTNAGGGDSRESPPPALILRQ